MTHDDEFNVIVKELTNNPYVLDMKNFRQHCDTSTFEHSYKVAYISYKICKKLNLDYKSVARAGMLHDFYLYDWRVLGINGMLLNMVILQVLMLVSYLIYLIKR